MGANKALPIWGVKWEEGTAWFQTYHHKWYRVGNADRSTLLAVGKFTGAFIGKGSPMGLDKEAMRSIVVEQIKLLAGNVPNGTAVQPEPKAQPAQPTASVQPKAEPKPEPTPSGSVDGAILTLIRQVVAEVVSATPSQIDPKELADLWNAVTLTDGKVDFLQEAVTNSLAELERKLAKQVPTQFVVNSVPLKPSNGVRHSQYRKVLDLVVNREHTYLVGPAGTGKSTIPQQIAEELGLPFYAVSCGTTDGKHDYAGYRDGHGVFHTTEFRKAFADGGVFLLDEMDNASPDMLVVLNSALANGFFAFPDGVVRKHPDFVCIGSGNTFGNGATAQYVGRSPIDAATMDRFTKLSIGVDEAVEDAMADAIGVDGAIRTQWVSLVRAARTNAERHGLRVLVTPRATVKGLKVLACGWTIDEAVDATFGFGLDWVQRNKLLEGVTL